MSNKYIAKIIKVIDSYTVVVNKGRNAGVSVGNKYLIIGLGETIIDPETNNELERLEIIRGKVEVIHVQEKIATLKSCQFGKHPDKKEITKVISQKVGYALPIGGSETVTESITPGDTYLLKINDVQVGDFIVKAL
jgi:hypothetical protein